jgi:hypothetical protein
MRHDWIRLQEIESVVESLWPTRLARALYIVACLNAEYRRGLRDGWDDDDTWGSDEEDEDCMGDGCLNATIYHSRQECFTAEMAENFYE